MAYQVEVKKEDKEKAVKTRPPKKLGRIETCEFKRAVDLDWERGFLLNEGDLGVLDVHGKVVDEVWSWRRVSVFVLCVGWFFDEWFAP